MNISLVLFAILLGIIAKSEQKYILPEIKIQALKPKGLVISVPDSNGVQQFAFHANINQPIKGKEDGTISREVGYAQNGRWTIHDPNVQLKVGDEVSYWIFVQHNRFGYDKQDQVFKVTELIEASTIPEDTPAICNPSTTEVDGKKVCANDKIFEDTFDSFNDGNWLKEQYVPWEPDYEFNTYEKHPENNYISNGNLVLKATLRDDLDSEINISNGCTRQDCVDTGASTIIAPIIGARITSKFSFKYGKIEIRAQLPKGDWLYPILYLEPKDNFYGAGYNSGRMWLAYARGNQDLKTAETGDTIGNNVLYMGPVLSKVEPQRTYKAHKIANTFGNLWGNEYHTFTVLWQPDGIRVSVDNSHHHDLTPPYAHPDGPYANLWSSNAPFDKEFVISLGIAAGGQSDFPDGSTSNGVKQPWNSRNAKARFLFYQDKDNWFNTWNGDNSALKIDYIRVWSI